MPPEPTLLKFAGFDLDRHRRELRGPDDQLIKLRSKTFNMLLFLVDHAGRIVSKRELLAALWPNVQVGDDSVFQCVRELRAALQDGKRQIVKSVVGVGYLFDVPVTGSPAGALPPIVIPSKQEKGPDKAPPSFVVRRPKVVAVLGALICLAIIAAALARNATYRYPPAVAVMPITGLDEDSAVTARVVSQMLADGLAAIKTLRVLTPDQAAKATASGTPPSGASDFLITGELRKADRSWILQARLVRNATREVVWAGPVSIAADAGDSEMQRIRLAAAVGHPLATRLNELMREPRDRASAAKAVIDQAIASIDQTNKERFIIAETMLLDALAQDPENADLSVALAALQMRGVQMQWYDSAKSVVIETTTKERLEQVLRATPDSLAAHEAYCRFLTATNRFSASLVACARALELDPWNGSALYHQGLTQIQLGRFEDALTTFKQANQFDTPSVSRFTWLLGAGWTCLLMGRVDDALPWLQRSLAITAASGRPYLLLAAAYQQLGRTDDAKAALAKALDVRPGLTAGNAVLSTKNASPVFLAAQERMLATLIAVGLPER